MVQAKRKYMSRPGMKVGKATKEDTLKIVNGKSGEVKDTGKRIVIDDRTPGTRRHAQLVQELENLTEQIKAGAREIGLRFYEVGSALLVVQDEQLWRVGGFESFTKYLASIKEIRTPQTANNMMSVARALDRHTAARFGPSICYVIARSTDEEARKELTRMASDGATATEMRLVAKQQREEKGVKRSTGRPPKQDVERAVAVVGANGVEKTKVAAKEVKASAKARKRDDVGVVAGEMGTVQLTEQTSKTKKKAGWTQVARFQLGENGPDIRLEYHAKRKQLKYEVM